MPTFLTSSKNRGSTRGRVGRWWGSLRAVGADVDSLYRKANRFPFRKLSRLFIISRRRSLE